MDKAIEDARTLSLKRVDRAIVFMDIRGFTAWSEQQTPEAVVGMLNGFYAAAQAAPGEVLASVQACAAAGIAPGPTRDVVAKGKREPVKAAVVGGGVRVALYLLLGKLNTAPSRTPALGQRWVIVLRLV